VSTYTIGEIAERSGFSTSALRYYEGIGLVMASTRTEAGYRVYDDHTLDRLAFIARAKQLGCSLEEVADLVEIWDGERCGAVQRQFHELVTTKVADTERQIAELVAFAGQLQAAAAQLGEAPIEGPCGEGCACVADAPAAADAPPIACTLEAEAVPERIADWQDLLGRVRSRAATNGGGLRIQFDDAVSVEELFHLLLVLLLRHHD
jgi:DNA-binding transcriptional MerR regulator